MAELETHAATDEAGFEHRSAPSGSVDGDRNGLGAKYRMARDQRLVPTFIKNGVKAIFGSNLQDRSRGKIVKMDTAFNFGLDDVAVDVIAQVGVGWKQLRMVASGVHGRPAYR